MEFVLSTANAPPGVRKIEVPILNGRTSVLAWQVATQSGPLLVTRFEQLASVCPDAELSDDEPKQNEAVSHAIQLSQVIKRLSMVESASALTGTTHRRTHLLIAAKLLESAPATATLADLNSYLPAGSQLLNISGIEASDIQAERLHGLLAIEGTSIVIPRFYQSFLVNTLKKERIALKKARNGMPKDGILLSELVVRLVRAAQIMP